jgi:hypothetical protein
VLVEFKEYLIKIGYSDDELLCGFRPNNNAKEIIVIVLPSFAEICLNVSPKKETLYINNWKVKLVDFRTFFCDLMAGKGLDLLYKIKCNPLYETIINSFENKKDFPYEEAALEIYKILFKKEYFKETRTDDFKNLLTNKEKIAYENLLNELTDGEGIIRIKKLSEKTNLGRANYDSLLKKIKSYDKLATIVNKGTKGTYIRLNKED